MVWVCLSLLTQPSHTHRTDSGALRASSNRTQMYKIIFCFNLFSLLGYVMFSASKLFFCTERNELRRFFVNLLTFQRCTNPSAFMFLADFYAIVVQQIIKQFSSSRFSIMLSNLFVQRFKAIWRVWKSDCEAYRSQQGGNKPDLTIHGWRPSNEIKCRLFTWLPLRLLCCIPSSLHRRGRLLLNARISIFMKFDFTRRPPSTHDDGFTSTCREETQNQPYRCVCSGIDFDES